MDGSVRKTISNAPEPCAGCAGAGAGGGGGVVFAPPAFAPAPPPAGFLAELATKPSLRALRQARSNAASGVAVPVDGAVPVEVVGVVETGAAAPPPRAGA